MILLSALLPWVMLWAQKGDEAPEGNTKATGMVLLDTYYNHEVDEEGHVCHYTWEDTSWGGFSEFGERIERAGLRLGTLNTKPTAEGLSRCSAYIIVDPDHIKDNPQPNYMTASDAKTIKRWVKKGGQLLVFANDHDNCDLQHINILTSLFGIHLNDTSLLNNAPPTRERPDTGYQLQGCIEGADRLFMRGTCSMQLTGKAHPLIWTREGDVLMAKAKHGKGEVIVVADPWVYNEYIGHNVLPETMENGLGAKFLVEFLSGEPTQSTE